MVSELAPSVNDAKQVVRAAPEKPLLFLLRNGLKLTGRRLGCGMAQCGACSVTEKKFALVSRRFLMCWASE